MRQIPREELNEFERWALMDKYEATHTCGETVIVRWRQNAWAEEIDFMTMGNKHITECPRCGKELGVTVLPGGDWS